MELEHDMSLKKSNFIPVFIKYIFFFKHYYRLRTGIFVVSFFFSNLGFFFLKETIYDPFDSVYMYIVYHDLLRETPGIFSVNDL